MGCRERRPSPELLRFTLDEGAGVRLDYRGSASGRGAWLCARPRCLRKALERNGFSRAFRRQVATPEVALREAIRTALVAAVEATLTSACRAWMPADPESGSGEASFEAGFDAGFETGSGIEAADAIVWGEPPRRWVVTDRARARALLRNLARYRAWNEDGSDARPANRASRGAREER